MFPLDYAILKACIKQEPEAYQTSFRLTYVSLICQLKLIIEAFLVLVLLLWAHRTNEIMNENTPIYHHLVEV